MDHPNPPTPAHQIAASVGFLYCQIADVNQQPPESPVGGADLSSPARPREVSYHPTTAAHRSQTKTSPQSHSKSPETRSSNKNASGDQSPNTRINAHDSGPPHPIWPCPSALPPVVAAPPWDDRSIGPPQLAVATGLRLLPLGNRISVSTIHDAMARARASCYTLPGCCCAHGCAAFVVRGMKRGGSWVRKGKKWEGEVGTRWAD